ncbi:MAG: Bax inhibitor-1/YccA family protein [Verrucomicrobiae bacterium]|nr:Bax inhibitor-1/YccA family protein [Verrucomicrobiae bacterium]
MQSSNPVLRNDPFASARPTGAVMTIGGAVWKTVFLLLLAVVTGSVTWVQFNAHGAAVVLPWVLVSSLVAFGVAVGVSFKPNWAPALAPVYGLLEGVVLGGISAWYTAQYPGKGIAVAAAGGTVATLAGLLFAYQTGLIRATPAFKRGVIAATLGILLFYFASMVLGLFGIRIPGVFESGWVGIGFSLFVVAIAAMNLVIDFDFIEQSARSGAPKHMEWYAAFALMVTLVWLYLEILRLLAKVAGRR